MCFICHLEDGHHWARPALPEKISEQQGHHGRGEATGEQNYRDGQDRRRGAKRWHVPQESLRTRSQPVCANRGSRVCMSAGAVEKNNIDTRTRAMGVTLVGQSLDATLAEKEAKE